MSAGAPGRVRGTTGGASMDGLATLGVRATLARSSSHVRLLRLLVLLAPFVVLGATMAEHGAFQPVACLVVGVLAVGGAISTDAHVGLLTMLVLGVNWLQTVDDETTPWVLVAAAGLVLLHTALAALTVTPPAARWQPDRARVWASRALLATGAAGLAWLLSLALADRTRSGSAVMLTVALVSLVAVAAWVRDRSLRR